MIGGVRAVMYTDAAQLALIVFAVAAVTYTAYTQVDVPIGELWNQARAADKLHWFDYGFDLASPYTLWTAILGNMVFFAAVFGTDHDLAQRFLTARSVRSGMVGVVLSQVVGLVAVALFMAVGLLLWGYYQHHEPPEPGRPVFVHFMVYNLPPWVAGLAVAGVFAAAQSSMDSATNAIAASLVHDIHRPGEVVENGPPPRLVSLGVGVLLTGFGVACCFAFPEGGGFLDFALRVMTLAVCGLAGVFVCAFYTTRGNAATVVGALVTGAVLMFLLPVVTSDIHWFWFVPFAVLASFIVCVSGGRRGVKRGFEIFPETQRREEAMPEQRCEYSSERQR